MDDHRNKVAEAFEGFVEGTRWPWEKIVVVAGIVYLAARFIPWAWHGFPVVR